MDIGAYLERIGYSGPREPSLATLTAMQAAHFANVPFETLDIHLGRPSALEPDAVFDKVVRRRRGGWCHELNGLWARALRRLGFEVDVLGANIANPVPRPIAFGHTTVLVHFDEPWLSDVGLGGRTPAPMRLLETKPQRCGDTTTTIWNEGARWFFESEVPHVASLQVEFTLQPREFEEFHESAEWQATSPQSHFTHRPSVMLPTAAGRINLLGSVLTEVRDGERSETTIASIEEFDTLLAKRFGIELYEHEWRNFPWPQTG